MPRNVDLPDTSKDAYKALTPEKLSKDYSDIVRALRTLKEHTYEGIAAYLGYSDLNKVSRRLKEMEAMQIIYKPGNKYLTTRNRSAYTYKLVENGEVSAQPEKLMSGTTVGEFAQRIIQKDLFNQ